MKYYSSSKINFKGISFIISCRFNVSLFAANGLNNIPSAISCDGQYLYILNSSGLFKVGSGYGSTIKVVVNAASISFVNCS